MKRRKFAEGGYTDQEASDLMLRDIVPKRESIRLTSDEPATPQSAADTAAENAAMAREMAREARAAAPRPAAPRPAATPSPAPTSAPSRSNQNDYSMNESEGSGRGTSTRAPSRGDYSRNGPVGDAIEGIKGLMGKLPRGRAAAKRKLLRERPLEATPMKKGGAVKAKRGDGIAQRGKTKGRFV